MCLLSDDDTEYQEEFYFQKREGAINLIKILEWELDLVLEIVEDAGVDLNRQALLTWLHIRKTRLPSGLSDKETAEQVTKKDQMEAVWLSEVLKGTADVDFQKFLHLDMLQRRRQWYERMIAAPNLTELGKAVSVLKNDPLFSFLTGGDEVAHLDG